MPWEDPCSSCDRRLPAKHVGSVRSAGFVECDIASLPLAPGRYSLSPGCRNAGVQIDYVARAVEIEVIPGQAFASGRLPAQERWAIPSERVVAHRHGCRDGKRKLNDERLRHGRARMGRGSERV